MKATYVYCVIAAPKAPRPPRMPRGLPGSGAVRLLQVAEGLFAAVADAPLERYGEAAIRRTLCDLDAVSRAALAHEALVESFASQGTVLPMKLFTIFKNDARAVEHVRAQRARIAAIVERVAHHDEWGVRVVRNRAVVAPGKAASRSVSGVAYLRSKATPDDPQAELLFRRLAACARHARRRNPGRTFDAAFLVPRKRAARFQAQAKRESRRLARAGYRLALSGPWPPYSFMQESR